MRLILITTLLLCFCCCSAFAQQNYIKGKVINAISNGPLKNASVEITKSANSAKHGATTDTTGIFSVGPLGKGEYKVSVSYLGFEKYTVTVSITNSSVDLGQLYMTSKTNTLDEVKIVEKILAVTQKEDTTEYNAAAYKVNPDADAADLVRKMPSINLNGKDVKAQGETVTKVLIDGKPFFGDNAYTSLCNLPAEIIDKVQVYNEKSEQELFTGFSEGNTTKTINIITKPNKRHGKFGKLYAGYGGDDKYLAGGTLNDFGGDKRVTVTAQNNNINIQNFSEQNLVSSPGGNTGGTVITHSGGINYTDKWGKKLDITGSYFFNESNSTSSRSLRQQDLLAQDSGHIYNEQSNNANTNQNHRLNFRINYNIDSANSILLTPSLGLQKNVSSAFRLGSTLSEQDTLNRTGNNSNTDPLGYNFSFTALYRHKFAKKGRTFSINTTANNNGNNSTNYLYAVNTYYNNISTSDTLNQRVSQDQNTWNINTAAVYTEPIAQKGLLQLQYIFSYIPSASAKQAYDYDPRTAVYSIADDTLSNKFRSRNTASKAGGSYQAEGKKYLFSAGLYYQFTRLKNEQELPYINNTAHDFSNLMPTAHFQYKFSKTNNINITYNTTAGVPSISQLQQVINNSNPLFLSIGNPDLKQPYQHNVSIRYNLTNPKKETNFYIGLTNVYGLSAITNNTIIALSDTSIRIGTDSVFLHKGSQLTMPVNIDGYENITAYIGYSVPLRLIKSNLGFNINTGFSHAPGIINNTANFTNSENAALSVTLGSNINENIDFTFTSSGSLSSSTSTLNSNLSSLYFNQSDRLLFNLIFWKGFVFNTDVSYQHNGGLSGSYNVDYTVWNVAFGKKMLKKRAGDIRVVLYDILNQNTNIQHTISQSYIQDIHTNLVKRYFLVTFTYNIRSFN